MQWAPGRNAGFSTANPQKLYLPAIFDPDTSAVNVEAATEQRPLSLVVAQPLARLQASSGVWPRRPANPLVRQPKDAGVCAPAGRREAPDRRQFVAVRATYLDEMGEFQDWLRSKCWAGPSFDGRGRALSPHARAVCVLLVHPDAGGRAVYFVVDGAADVDSIRARRWEGVFHGKAKLALKKRCRPTCRLGVGIRDVSELSRRQRR